MNTEHICSVFLTLGNKTHSGQDLPRRYRLGQGSETEMEMKLAKLKETKHEAEKEIMHQTREKGSDNRSINWFSASSVEVRM